MFWVAVLLLRVVLIAEAFACSAIPGATTLISAGFAFISLMLFAFSLLRLQLAVP